MFVSNPPGEVWRSRSQAVYLNLEAGYLACKGLTGIESLFMLYTPLGIQRIGDVDDDNDVDNDDDDAHLRLLYIGTFWLHLPIPITKIAVSIPTAWCRNYHITNSNLLGILQEDIAFDAVSVGAILSDYQRIRVENV